MRADDAESPQQRACSHMELVRGVHRRAAFERISGKIERLEKARIAVELGLGDMSAEHMAELQAELAHLRKRRVTLWREMVAAGQVPLSEGLS